MQRLNFNNDIGAGEITISHDRIRLFFVFFDVTRESLNITVPLTDQAMSDVNKIIDAMHERRMVDVLQ